MGTVSIGNSEVERKLDNVDSSIQSNTTAIGNVVSSLGNLIGRVGAVLKELRIANVHNEVITGEKITKQDIPSNG